ncbi:MAG: hypothetical protein WDN28_00170 [Chthoniobacter sp.]
MKIKSLADICTVNIAFLTILVVGCTSYKSLDDTEYATGKVFARSGDVAYFLPKAFVHLTIKPKAAREEGETAVRLLRPLRFTTTPSPFLPPSREGRKVTRILPTQFRSKFQKMQSQPLPVVVATIRRRPHSPCDRCFGGAD